MGQGVVIIECPKIGQELFGKRAQFDVGFLRPPLEKVERRVGVDAVHHHQDALDLLNDGPVRRDLGDGVADERFAILGRELPVVERPTEDAPGIVGI